MSSPNPIPAQRPWPKKCILLLVGSVETVLVLVWKGPAASAIYLLLVFWSFVIYEGAVLAQIYASRRTIVRLRSISIGSASRLRGPTTSDSDLMRHSQIPATTSIATNSTRSAEEHSFTNNTISSTHSTADVFPNATASRFATTSDTPAPADDPHDEILTPRTRRRTWASKRPLTPITTMKPSQSALERYASPRRPFAPLNMQQRQNDRSSTEPETSSTGHKIPMLRTRTLPKPWPRSISRVDVTRPYRRSFSAAPCHMDANCSRSGCPDSSSFLNS